MTEKEAEAAAISSLALKLSNAQWRGSWSPGVKYKSGDLVYLGGRTYFSLNNANLGHRPENSPYWHEILPTHTTVAGSAGVAGSGLSGSGTTTDPFKLSPSTQSTLGVVSSAFPGSTSLAAQYLPAPVLTSERYVAPNGNDSAIGDEARPLQYLKTAWLQLAAVGGGTIYVADGTIISADGHGLFIAGLGGGVLSPTAVPFMAVSVIGWGGLGTRGFTNIPPALLLGGALDPSSEMDDPAIWISGSVSRPMSFSNLRFGGNNTLNKGMRWGWDYTRDDTGAIIKQNVTGAVRSSGQTVLTVDPVSFNICKIKRVANVVSVSLKFRAGQRTPIHIGMSVFVNFTSSDFTPATLTVVDTVSDVESLNTITFASTGSPFTTGTIGGATIGAVTSNLALPRDYITLYGGTSEFPASTYRATAVTSTTITVTDYYGYSPRSASASASNIGTYAVHNRLDFAVARVNMANVGASLITNDLSTERFVSGPNVDLANVEFFRGQDWFFDGYDVASVAGQAGCRDPERRAAILCDVGSAAAAVGFGDLDGVTNGYGGIRYRCSSNGTAVVTIKNVICDLPITGFQAVPAVEVLDGISSHNIYLENISVVDVSGTPAIKVNANSPWSCVTVNTTYGDIEGPCNIINGNFAQLEDANAETPNRRGQYAVYGPERLLAGKHMAAFRHGGLGTAVLPSQGLVEALPANWQSIAAGVTVTITGIRDPFGGTSAIRLSSATDGKLVSIFGRHIGVNSAVGDIYIAAMWFRGNTAHSDAYGFSVQNNAQTEVYLSKTAFPPRPLGGEWNCLVVGGRLAAADNGGTPVTTDTITRLQLTLNAGASVDVFEPTIYCLPASDAAFSSVSDNEVAEIVTHGRTSPGYLSTGMLGTHYGQKVIAHGGIGTGLTYVEGAGSGALTIVGSFSPKRYQPTFAADGTTIRGWSELVNATINP